MIRLRIPTVLLGSILFPLIAAPLGAESVTGAYAPVSRPVPTPRLLAASEAAPLTPSLAIDLPPVSTDELSAMQAQRSRSKAHMIGFARPVPVPYRDDVISRLQWSERGDGSLNALVTIRSPGAAALRAKLNLGQLPPGVQFSYFALSENNPPIGPLSYDLGPFATDALKRQVWTPVVAGDGLGIEIRLPIGTNPEAMALPISRISHITESPVPPQERSTSKALDDSSLCQIDVACRNTAPWDTVKDAVAKITYVEDGRSFLCTGTLLIDQETGTWIPYFLSANHCANTPEEAASVNSVWFYQRTSCGGTVDNGVQLSAGAWLLRSGEISDFSLMELAEPAPGGAYFAGWSTDTNLFQAVSGIHHPRGDVKKIASGSIIGASSCRESTNCGFDDIEVTWNEGHTESGSSGSGMFDSSGKLVGTLWGGTSYCTAQTTVSGTDFYGRFAYTLPLVTRFLQTTAVRRDAGSVSNGSVEQGSWRDFRIDTDDSTRFLEVILHELHDDANLYVRIGGKPTLANRHCASEGKGNAAEFCSLRVTPGNVVYIGILGLQTTNFSLTINSSASGVGLADSMHPPPRMVDQFALLLRPDAVALASLTRLDPREDLR